LMDSNLSDVSIHHARGVGPQRAKLFARIGITSIKESLWYLPNRYEDRTGISHIADIKEGSLRTIRGTVIAAESRGGRGTRQGIFEIVVDDGSASVKARWFNQSFIGKNLCIGRVIMMSGDVKKDLHTGAAVFDNPEYEMVGQGGEPFIHMDRIVPIYGLTDGISQKQIRKIMFDIVADYAGDVVDPLPEDIIRRHNLPPLRESIKELHFPSIGSDMETLNRRAGIYHKRLVFDELFILELGVALTKKGKGRERGRALACKGLMRRRLMKKLSFGLTGAQERVIDEITKDLSASYAMRRLLQGDVGCGKTVVALMAMLHAVECGCQTAFMAPTEVLAEQHYYFIRSMVEDMGIKTALVVGGRPERHLDVVASGEAQLVVGTHALITEGVFFRDLGLVVIDEQHKFGVMQRALLGRNCPCHDRHSDPDVFGPDGIQ
jgi:ATP-dependent DNA helicase RecG